MRVCGLSTSNIISYFIDLSDFPFDPDVVFCEGGAKKGELIFMHEKKKHPIYRHVHTIIDFNVITLYYIPLTFIIIITSSDELYQMP
jgi:hypothetical protein